MATFKPVRSGDIGLTFEDIAEIPEDVAGKMLSQSADIAVAALKRSVTAAGLVDTGQLRDSIKKQKPKRGKDGSHSIIVSPSGSRKRATAGQKKAVSNAAVGYVREFGAPKRGIPASQWMRSAVEGCADEVEKAQLAVYDDWLKSKNL